MTEHKAQYIIDLATEHGLHASMSRSKKHVVVRTLGRDGYTHKLIVSNKAELLAALSGAA